MADQSHAERAQTGPARAGRWARPSVEPQLREVRALAATRAGRWMVVAVVAIATLTVAGLLALWPYGWHAPRTHVTTPTVSAKVVDVREAPCDGAQLRCRTLTIDIDGRRYPLGLGMLSLAPEVRPGTTIRVTREIGVEANPRAQPYQFAGIDRRGSLAWLGVLGAILAIALLRWRGVLAVAGVGLSLGVLLEFVVPAILAGRPALLVALVASLTVMFITLVLTNGVGAQTLAGVLGIAATLALTCVLAWLAARFAHIDGKNEAAAATLGVRDGSVSLQGIVLAAMLIGALGVLADTAVTQASAVMALRRTSPSLTARGLYRAAITVGRDHLSATIHTLVLAYAGATLTLLLLLRSGSVSGTDILNNQSIAEPIVAAIVGCVALIAAVPITTGLAAFVVGRVPAAALPVGDHHHHH
jgi:uncharacterized membrane protein